MALVALAATLERVALKVTVDRWAAATGEARVLTYEAALAVRRIEIGLASLLSLLFGFTLTVFGLATRFSARYPTWLASIGLLGGLGTVVAGASQASTGFSGLATTISMLASSVLLVWIILAGILMWRLAPKLARDTDAA
jgi:hypothetical protein